MSKQTTPSLPLLHPPPTPPPKKKRKKEKKKGITKNTYKAHVSHLDIRLTC